MPHGRRLRGTVPKKFEVGTAHAAVAPNISVYCYWMDVMKMYELTKKRSQGGIFCSEIEAFGQAKGHICYISDFRQQRQAKDKQNRVDD